LTADRARRAGLILVVALALAAHARALGGGFVIDDRRFVTENAALEGMPDPVRIVVDPCTADPSRPADIYRPLRTLDFAVGLGLFGRDPRPWHAESWLLHAAVAALLYLLLIRLGCRPAAAAAGAAFFALHPATVEPVAWVSARADLLAALFALAAAHAWLRSRGPDGWFCSACGLGLLACLSKESAVVFPAVLLAADLARAEAGPREAWARRGRYVLPVLLAGGYALAATALIRASQGRVGHLAGWWGGSYGANLATAARAAAYGILHVAFPARPSFDWFLPASRGLPEPGAVAAALLVLGLVAAGAAAVLRGGRGARLAGAGVLLAAGAALPTSHLLFPVGHPTADRFLYLPLAGAAMVAAAAFERASRASPRGAAALAAVAAISLGTITWQRTAVWRDEESLWRDGPAGAYSPRAEMFRLKREAAAAGLLLDCASAARHRAQPEAAEAALAGALSAYRRLVAGAGALNRFWVDCGGTPVDVPFEAQERRNLAIVLLWRQDGARALREAEAAVALEPGDPSGIGLEACALHLLGRTQRAGWRIERALDALDWDPEIDAYAGDILARVAAWRLRRGLDGAAVRALRGVGRTREDRSLIRGGATVPEKALAGVEAAVAEVRRRLEARAAAKPLDFRAQAALVEGVGLGTADARAARAAFDRAFHGRPESAPLRNLWARATMESLDTEEGWSAAEAWHRDTRRRFPGDPGALLGLARCRESFEDAEGAARCYREARDCPAADEATRAAAADGLARLGK
jgi:hypothetical protein